MCASGPIVGGQDGYGWRDLHFGLCHMAFVAWHIFSPHITITIWPWRERACLRISSVNKNGLNAGHVVRYGSVRYYSTVRFFHGCKYGLILRYDIFLQVRYGTKVWYFFLYLIVPFPYPVEWIQRLASPVPSCPPLKSIRCVGIKD